MVRLSAGVTTSFPEPACLPARPEPVEGSKGRRVATILGRDCVPTHCAGAAAFSSGSFGVQPYQPSSVGTMAQSPHAYTVSIL
jgi:hypothetical protein